MSVTPITLYHNDLAWVTVTPSAFVMNASAQATQWPIPRTIARSMRAIGRRQEVGLGGFSSTDYFSPPARFGVGPPQPRPRRPATGAGDRARDLLMSCLTAAQRLEYETHMRFTVVSNRGHIFRIQHARMHNILRLDAQGKAIEEWCVTPFGNLPVCDVLLAQKVWLEADEDELATRANITCLVTGRMRHRAELQYGSHIEADYLRAAS